MHARRQLQSALTAGLLAFLSAGPLTASEPLERGSPAHYTSLGISAQQRGQFESAISSYESALEIDPSFFPARFNLALAHQEIASASPIGATRTDHFAVARSHYTEARKLRRDHPEVLCNLGIIAYHEGEWQQAAHFFRDAADAAEEPVLIAAYAFNLATALERLGEWSEARRAYERCLSLDPSHFAATYNLGSLLLTHLDDLPDADRYLRQAHELDPNRPEPLLNLAVLVEQRGRGNPENLYDQAVTAALANLSPLTTTVLWKRARFYERAELPDRPTRVLMRKDLESILELDPDFPGANGMLGAYYYRLAEWEQAAELLEREVAEGNYDPESEIDLTSHVLLAIIYKDHLRDIDRAMAHATAYYNVRPDNSGEALKRQLTGRSGGQAVTGDQ